MLTVDGVNDVPVAESASFQTTIDAPLAASVVGTDVDGDELSYSIQLQAANGSVSMMDDGAFVYQPNIGYLGADSFTYLASDAVASSDEALVEIEVTGNPVEPPEATDNEYTLLEDSTLSIGAPGVLENDTDTVEPLNLIAEIVNQPAQGAVVLNADGSFDYTPAENYFGEDVFSYRATDEVTGESSQADVVLTVDGVNDVPVAEPASFQTTIDAPLAASVVGTDVDGDELLYSIQSQAVNGSVSMMDDGSFVYQPNSGYLGADSFTYIASDGEVSSTEALVEIEITDNPVIDSDLLVQLGFDDGVSPATDSSGRGNFGIINGATFAPDTIDGSALSLQFDGVDDSVDLGAIDIVGSELTLAAWFKAESFPGNSQDPRIISKAQSTAGNDHIFMLSTIEVDGATRLRARLRIGGETTTLIATHGDLVLDRWTHAAMTYDGSRLDLYVDGVEVANRALTGVIDVDPEVNVAVGSQPDGVSRLFHGYIDDVRIVQRAYSAAEIQSIVGLEGPAANISANPTIGVAPLGVDFSSIGSSDNDGTIVSYAWDFGDNASANGSFASHVYAEPGSYSATLTVTDNDGLSDQSSVTILVRDPSDPGSSSNWTFFSTTTGDIQLPGGGAREQTMALSFDVNGDTINDLVVGTRRGEVGPSIEWWQKVGNEWISRVIETDLLPLEAGGAVHDIDGDGDLDFVVGEDGTGTKVYWWENPSPFFQDRWTRREVKNADGRRHHDQVFGDFDGDGRVELVYWNNVDRALFLAEIPNDPTIEPWPATVIYNANTLSEGLAAYDIDGDGVEDIVGAGFWFKHVNGAFIANEIDSTQGFTRVAVGQLIEGGLPEVVFDSGDTIGRLNMYTWDGSNWLKTDLLGEDSSFGHSLAIGDVNLDGHLDIMSGEMDLRINNNPKLRMLYGDGQGNFGLELVSTGIDNHESKLIDLDGDGDLDIFGKPFVGGTPQINVWLNNIDQVVDQDWNRVVLDGGVPYRTIFVEHGDIDLDGHEDVITGAWWWKNPGFPGGLWARFTIGDGLNQMATVADFDSDGDLDIIGTEGIGSISNSNLTWARNDGAGNFDVFANIGEAEGAFLQGATVAEFRDGIVEIALSWQNCVGGLQMVTVPSAAEIDTETWSTRVVSQNCSGEGLDTGDIDGDGDVDLTDGAYWYRNELDNSFTQFDLTGSTTGIPDRNVLVDMDHDGDLDVVIGFGHDSQRTVAWYEQPENETGTWIGHLIDNLDAGFAQSVDVADLDGNGSFEVIVGEHSTSDPAPLKLQVYSQTDGVWNGTLIHQGDEHHDGAQLFDFDNDGDLDVVSIGWRHRRLLLYMNNLPPGSIGGVVDAPDQLTGHALSDSRVELSWNSPSIRSGVLRYNVYRNGTLIATVSTNRLTDNVEGIEESLDYSVEAVTGDGVVSEQTLISIDPVNSVSGAWWNLDWPYRVLLGITAGNVDRENRTAELEVNFADFLDSTGATESIEPANLRCHEVDVTGEIIKQDIHCQFDTTDLLNQNLGVVSVYLDGSTSVGTPRYFHLYFDLIGGNGVPSSQSPLVLIEDVIDEFQEAFKITNLTGEFFYQKEAAGFSSLVDKQNNDWIGYSLSPGVTGSFRGIPNLIHPESEFHPGATGSTSNLVISGPVKKTIESHTNDGLWNAIWSFYPHSVELSVHLADRDYWVLYEGTPGGSLDPQSDFVVRSSGESTLLSDAWSGDLEFEEWVYFADPVLSRSLFILQHEDDQSVDSYRSGSDQMTIFGFGRDGTEKGLDHNSVPARFTFGLVDNVTFNSVQRVIDSLAEPVSGFFSEPAAQ